MTSTPTLARPLAQRYCPLCGEPRGGRALTMKPDGGWEHESCPDEWAKKPTCPTHFIELAADGHCGECE